MKKIILLFQSLILLGCFQEEKRNELNEETWWNEADCKYIHYDGKARIISMKVEPINYYKSTFYPITISIFFTPNDTACVKNYLHDYMSDTSTLYVEGNNFLSHTFIDSLEISIGNEYKCIRYESIEGTCGSVYFKVIEIDPFTKTWYNINGYLDIEG